MQNRITIGRLARDAGLAAETLRYYERLGLIQPIRRTESNYRLYDSEAGERLRFVRRAQQLGFSLAEIRELLDLRCQPEADMGVVRETAREKIADIDRKMADLKRMRDALAVVTDRCPGHGPIDQCPILASLAGPGGDFPEHGDPETATASCGNQEA